MSGADDLELVELALEGDQAARRELARRLLAAIQREVTFVLVRFAAADKRDARQDVVDLVQEVLVHLFDHDGRELRRWDPERGRSLESFVRLVARRRVSRILSARQGNPWADVAVDPAKTNVADDDGLRRRLEERNELDRLLGALHAKMSDRDHELFDLLFVQGLSPEEVSLQMDMSKGAVNAWSYRTRKLARALGKKIEDEARIVSSKPDPTTKGVRTHG